MRRGDVVEGRIEGVEVGRRGNVEYGRRGGVEDRRRGGEEGRCVPDERKQRRMVWNDSGWFRRGGLFWVEFLAFGEQ